MHEIMVKLFVNSHQQFLVFFCFFNFFRLHMLASFFGRCVGFWAYFSQQISRLDAASGDLAVNEDRGELRGYVTFGWNSILT